MSLIIYAVLGVAALWFFLPAPGETGLRNAPLFAAVLALIALSLLLKWIRVFLRMHRVSSLLRRNGCTVKRKIRGDIVSFTASHGGKDFRVLLFHRRRPHARYHFDTAAFLEIYKTTTAVAKANIAGRVSVAPPQTRLISRVKLAESLSDPALPKTFVLFDRMPAAVTTSQSKTPLGNGDPLFAPDAVLYEESAFREYLPEYLAREC